MRVCQLRAFSSFFVFLHGVWHPFSSSTSKIGKRPQYCQVKKRKQLVSVMPLWGIPWMETLERIRSDSTGKEQEKIGMVSPDYIPRLHPQITSNNYEKADIWLKEPPLVAIPILLNYLNISRDKADKADRKTPQTSSMYRCPFLVP